MADFVPREGQADITDWIARHKRCGVWAMMGLGKTGSTLFALEALNLVEDVYPALVLAPLRVANSTWPNETQKFDNFHHLRVSAIAARRNPKTSATAADRAARVETPADIYTLPYGNLTWLVEYLGDDWPFRTIVADECFVAGTLVDTPAGPCAIQTICAGDEVITHAGAHRVRRAQKRFTYAFNLVSLELSNGGRIETTAEHPFFTDAGWLPARACGGRRVFGRDCLSDLPVAVPPGAHESAVPGAHGPDPVLQPGMPHQGNIRGAPRDAPTGARGDAGSECWPDEFVELWSAMVRRPSGKYVGGEEGEAFSGAAWGKRHWHVPHGGTNCAPAARGLHLELRRTVGGCWAGLSLALQARLRRQGADGLSGDRRKLPPYTAGPGAGRAEDGAVTVVRVDRCPDHQRSGMAVVFNLEVEGAPTYFAGGVLVHNCTRLKSFRLQQGGANARALGKRAFRSERFIGLTGTPSPNGVKDLWGQTWFIDKGERLGKSFSAFSMRWFVTGYDGFSIKPKETAQAEIEGLLADVCRTIEGPPVDDAIVAPIYVDLPPKARELYRRMEKTAFAEIAEMGVEAPNAAVKVNKLLQIASGNIYHEDGWEPVHDAKLEALESIVEEANGAPVLVQYNYQADLERILKHFRTARHLDADPKTEDRWNRGEIPILVAHGASAGHGLNLQDGGHILARYSFDWNFEIYAQILERIGPLRQKQSGYNRRVYDYPILARNTFDEAVFERHGEKCSVQDMLLNALRRQKEK